MSKYNHYFAFGAAFIFVGLSFTGCKNENLSSQELSSQPNQFAGESNIRVSEIGGSFFEQLYKELLVREGIVSDTDIDNLIQSLASPYKLISEKVIKSGTIAAATPKNPRLVYSIDTPFGPEYIGVFQDKSTEQPSTISIEGLVYLDTYRSFQPVLLEFIPRPKEKGELHLTNLGLTCAGCHKTFYLPITSRYGPSIAVQTVYASDQNPNATNEFVNHVTNSRLFVSPDLEKVDRSTLKLYDESLLSRRERVNQALKIENTSMTEEEIEFYSDLDVACGVCHDHFPNDTLSNLNLSYKWLQSLNKGFKGVSQDLMNQNNPIELEFWIRMGIHSRMPTFERDKLPLSKEEVDLVNKAFSNVKDIANKHFYLQAAAIHGNDKRAKIVNEGNELGIEVAKKCYAKSSNFSFQSFAEQCKECCREQKPDKDELKQTIFLKRCELKCELLPTET